MISCQYEGPKETPVIFLGGHQYTVLNISYDRSTIILVDSDVLVDGSCPVVHHDLSFDNLWLRNTSSNDNLTFYFGCYSTGGPGVAVPPDLVTYKINCSLMGPFGEGASFVFTPDDHVKAQEHELDQDGHCSEVVSVPVRSEILMASNRSMLVMGGYAEVLWYGFELEWYPTPTATDQCYLCEQSDGKCAYGHNQKREFLGCLCSNNTVYHPDCKQDSDASSAFRPSKSFKTEHLIRLLSFACHQHTTDWRFPVALPR